MAPLRLRILFIGTNSPFSLVHLAALAECHDVVAVLQSVRRAGGLAGWANRLESSVLRCFAGRRGIPFARAIKEQLALVGTSCDRHGVEIACVASMTCLLPADLLDRPPHGFLNVHPAKLPEWRGPFPMFWQLSAERGSIGVTVHCLAAGEDDGPILMQDEVPVAPAVEHARLSVDVARRGAELLLECLDRVAAGTAVPIQRAARSPSPRARNVGPADADLVFRPDWPIERCARRMAMLGGMVRFPRPRLRDLGWLAKASGLWRDGAGPVRPSRLAGPGREGLVPLWHPQGHIDLRRSRQPRGWMEVLRACRRVGLTWRELW